MIGVPINGMPTAPLLQSGSQFDATRLIWIGSTNRRPMSPSSGTTPVASITELTTKRWWWAPPRRAPPWSIFRCW